MQIEMVRAKIHRATVIEADVDYEGSIGIDSHLLQQSGIFPYEAVHVWNVTRGSRLVTYAIEAEFGSGMIKTNGGAALHNLAGDIIIIAAFAYMSPFEAKHHRPQIIYVNNKNEITHQVVKMYHSGWNSYDPSI